MTGAIVGGRSAEQVGGVVAADFRQTEEEAGEMGEGAAKGAARP